MEPDILKDSTGAYCAQYACDALQYAMDPGNSAGDKTAVFMIKSTKQRKAEDVSHKIRRYQELEVQKSEIAREQDVIKAYFERESESTLSDSKLKTADYTCDAGYMTVQGSASVKVISAQLVKRLFGTAVQDFCTTKEALEINSKIRPVLAAIYTGEYIDRSPGEVIHEMTTDEKLCTLLGKKLTGDYKKDAQRIKNILGITDADADFYAYIYAEAVIYDKFCTYMSAAEVDVEEGLKLLRSAIVVDEGIKVTFKPI